ncbi:hypothetical protein K505DRAFT_407930 [Melanomma pulvis-pyrius CBS 109.77]|uniref:Uncharacterized protein n=1 Tax=Melanomma pulvis-pyrius CBS 109.77 TaxID=1314802 RepID=A0A6A6XAV6_9PLEO|nr:hypothetical protein K505DRAFT_407930 [Melanomma pulvis-pyrius CBS 109.77]
MHRNTLISALSLISSFYPAPATSEDPNVETESHTHNANHIFNAVHSSMRQWGSSLNHNGMSFFLATVPEGTQLYHGTSNSESVKGMEWLAFEPEHALIFAHPRGRGPGGRPPPGKGGPGERPGDGIEEQDDEEIPEDRRGGRGSEASKEGHGEHQGGKGSWPPPPHGHPPFDGPYHGTPPPPKGHPQEPPSDHGPPPPHHKPPFSEPHRGPPPPPSYPPPPHHGKPSNPHGPRPDDDEYSHSDYLHEPHHRPRPDHGPPPPHKRDRQHPLIVGSSTEPAKTGYLHTYVPKRPLKLLYLDGMSAGKTSNGTLDTQDILLLNLTSHGAMGGEYDRARGLCNLTSTLWQGKIDGVLRMEGGFEIILCEFEKHLKTQDIMPVVDNGWDGRQMGGWTYQKAITDRYHGIGGGRVVLDYSNFVSAFEYPGLDLWNNDVVSDTKMPRLQNASPDDLMEIKGAVTKMVLSGTRSEGQGVNVNWQEITDAVLQRYSAPLHHLHTNVAVRASKEAYASYLSTLLHPFIDHTARNSSAEVKRCISQFIPPLPASTPPFALPSLAHKAIHALTHTLCTTLLSASDIATLSLSRSLASTSPPPSHALQLVDSLREYLQWTSWKLCTGCGDAEICVVPIWPMGSLEQHRKPRCQSGEERGSSGYWGYRGFGPPPGEGPPGEGRPGQERPGRERWRKEKCE